MHCSLNLSHRDCIADVSEFGNVHSLDISHCYSIADVSALGNVHILNLSYCHDIMDVNALRYVHRLILPLRFSIHMKCIDKYSAYCRRF